MKHKIIEYLKEENIYNKIDDLIINDLVATKTIIDKLEQSIVTNGVLIKPRGKFLPFQNPAINSLVKYKLLYLNLCTQLSISEKARFSIERTAEIEEIDEF